MKNSPYFKTKHPHLCYNDSMKNWSINEKELKKNPAKYRLWKLEQQINFGTDGKKLPLKFIKKNIDILKIDPLKKLYLKFLLKS